MTWTLNFQGQIWNLLYLSQKWSACHEMKRLNSGLKCDHRVWPWPWPWPWIFKVKYDFCHISVKNSPIATKRKANIYRLNLRPQMWPSGLTLAMTLTLNFQGLPISTPRGVYSRSQATWCHGLQICTHRSPSGHHKKFRPPYTHTWFIIRKLNIGRLFKHAQRSAQISHMHTPDGAYGVLWSPVPHLLLGREKQWRVKCLALGHNERMHRQGIEPGT